MRRGSWAVTVHLYYGVFFGATGDWEATETLARTALALADVRQPDAVGPNPSGNEAAYMLAVACRHRVRSPSDLRKAMQALTQAEERGKHMLRGVAALRARTVTERVALSQMQAFSCTLLGEDWRVSDDFTMSRTEILEALDGATHLLEPEDDDLFKHIVQKQILYNILVLGTYEFLQNPRIDLDLFQTREFQDAVATLSATRTNKSDRIGLSKVTDSRYREILLGFGRWVIGDTTEVDVNQLLALIAKAEADRTEMPYDTERYSSLGRAMRDIIHPPSSLSDLRPPEAHVRIVTSIRSLPGCRQ